MPLSNYIRWASSLLLLYIPHVLASKLVPIRPGGHRNNIKRQSRSGMDLVSSETLWGAPDGQNPLATFTVHMPGDAENILSMERFDGMLTAVECKSNSIVMTFEDATTFAYAQRVWDWVNGAENYTFVLVAGPGHCGNNTKRIPYIISMAHYNGVANKATLAASRAKWKDFAHSYELFAGSIAKEGFQQKLGKREYIHEGSIDFNHNMTGSLVLGSGEFSAALTCLNCSTSGQFDVEFRISQKFFIPTGASVRMSPKGVSAIASIKLSGSGRLTDALEKSFDILSIPVGGLAIPGILELGPFLIFSIGASVLPIELTAGILSSATAKLDDSAIVEFDLLNPKKNRFSGWIPEVELENMVVDAQISGGVSAYLKSAIELKAEVLGKGFRVGLDLKVPNINAKLQAIVSTGAACKGENQTMGVRASVSVGASLTIMAFLNDDQSDPLFTVTLSKIDKPFAQKCWPFGPTVDPRWTLA